MAALAIEGVVLFDYCGPTSHVALDLTTVMHPGNTRIRGYCQAVPAFICTLWLTLARHLPLAHRRQLTLCLAGSTLCVADQAGGPTGGGVEPRSRLPWFLEETADAQASSARSLR